MTVNRGLLILGILLAIVGAVSVFVVNLIYAPPTDFIIAAREDIPAGTMLSDLPDDAFVQVPVQFTNRTARMMLEGVAQPQDLAGMKAAGAVLVQDIYKFQPLTLGSVVSADNPAAARVTRLGLDNPELIVMTIPGDTFNIPAGIQPGDRIDLAVAVNNVTEILQLEKEEEEGQIVLSPASNLAGIPNEALAAVLEEAGYVVSSQEGEPVAEATPTPTPEPTPEGPVLREPVTKILVRGAMVVAVRQDQTVAGIDQQGDPTIIMGDVTGLDVVIPREAFEFVTMAMNGGNLQLALLSPLVQESEEGPSLGASLQDLLDVFISDREALTEPAQ